MEGVFVVVISCVFLCWWWLLGILGWRLSLEALLLVEKDSVFAKGYHLLCVRALDLPIM